MAALVEIRNRDSMEFCTGLPADEESIESPLFTVMGNDWNFRFSSLSNAHFIGIIYYTYIQLKNARTKLRSFKFDYYVGTMDEQNSSLKQGTTTVSNNEDLMFCYIEESDLRRRLPPDYRTGNIIKFSFCFHLPSDPLFKVLSKPRDKYVQTRSYTDTSVGSLAKDFSVLLDSGLYHDVEIKSSKLSIKAHKNVLCARSEVLKAMLQTDMLEARTGIVKIEDIDVSCIQDFVKYLYTDTLPELNFDKAITLYEAGDKYAIRSLTIRCSEYLQDNLFQENACQCFALADAHNDEKLKDRVVDYILEAKLFVQDEFWSPFCERYPKIALDIYKFSHKNTSKN